ncbi:hypothetical protein B0A52_01556 [Exophiala mesophila]|uniref:Uncharacterized protein n=1 Tax=Exophiala mesophila TaxID=212818 RepID=A0A438NFE0_EXOME|nr:hypothetical protein B0A52_01556 [Exophiala mesophila]
MDPRQTLFQRQIRLDLERRRLQLDEESFQIQQELEALEQQQGSGYPDSEDSGLVVDLTDDTDEKTEVKYEPADYEKTKKPEILSEPNLDHLHTIDSHYHTGWTNYPLSSRSIVADVPKAALPYSPLPSSNLTLHPSINSDTATNIIKKPSKIVILKIPKNGPVLRSGGKTYRRLSRSNSIISHLPSPSSTTPHDSGRRIPLTPSSMFSPRSTSDPTHSSKDRLASIPKKRHSSRFLEAFTPIDQI